MSKLKHDILQKLVISILYFMILV